MVGPPPLPKGKSTTAGVSPDTRATLDALEMHDLNALAQDLIESAQAPPAPAEPDLEALALEYAQSEARRQQKEDSLSFSGIRYGDIKGPSEPMLLLARRYFPETMESISVSRSQFHVRHFVPDKRFIDNKVQSLNPVIVHEWAENPEAMIRTYVRTMNARARDVILDIRKKDAPTKPLSAQEFDRTFRGDGVKRLLKRAALLKEPSEFGGYVITPFHTDYVYPGSNLTQTQWYSHNVAIHEKTHYVHRVNLDEELAIELHRQNPNILRGRVQRHHKEQREKKIRADEGTRGYLVLEGMLYDRKGREVQEPRPKNIGKSTYLNDQGQLQFDINGKLIALPCLLPKGHPAQRGFRSKVQWSAREKALDVGTTPQLSLTPIDRYRRELSALVLSDDPVHSFAPSRLVERFTQNSNGRNVQAILNAMAASGYAGEEVLRERNPELHSAVVNHPLYAFWSGTRRPSKMISASAYMAPTFLAAIHQAKVMVLDDMGKQVYASDKQKLNLFVQDLKKSRKLGDAKIHQRVKASLGHIFGEEQARTLYSAIKDNVTIDVRSTTSYGDISMMYVYALTDAHLPRDEDTRKDFSQYVLSRVGGACALERGLMRMYFPDVARQFFPEPQSEELDSWTGTSEESIHRQSSFGHVWQVYQYFNEVNSELEQGRAAQPPMPREKQRGLFQRIKHCVKYVMGGNFARNKHSPGLEKRYVDMCPEFSSQMAPFAQEMGISQRSMPSSGPPKPRGYRSRRK